MSFENMIFERQNVNGEFRSIKKEKEQKNNF